MSDIYAYYAQDGRGEDGDHPSLISAIYLHRFVDDAHAATYVETEAQLWVESVATDAQYHDVRIVPDAGRVGDDSVFVAFTRDWDWGSSAGYRIYLRLGDTVVEVRVHGDPAISLTEAEQLATAQLACLEDGACLEPLVVPGFTPAAAAS